MPEAWKTTAVLSVAVAGIALPVLADQWSGVSSAPPAGLAVSPGSQAFEIGSDTAGFSLNGGIVTEQIGALNRAMDVDATQQLRLSAVRSVGATTGYLTLGGLQAAANGEHWYSPVVGFGMRVSLNRGIQLSGEILHHETDVSTGGPNESGETLLVRAAFRF